MLAEGSYSRYRQYKRYTAEFIAWLRQPPIADHIKAFRAQATKKSNKAKKKNSPKKESNDKNVQINSITVTQLLAFAKQASTQGRKLPVILHARICRAISARREFTRWFAAHQPDQAESNSRHSFFADVLEEILSLLEKEPSKSRRPVTKKDDSPSKTKPNSFSILECDDESDEADAIESDESQSEESMSEVTSQTEPIIIDDVNSRDLQMEEAIFAASCFFRELNGIRQHVSSLWQLYYKGKADLFSTSLTTNTALEMVRRSEDDFLTRFPRYRGTDAWLDFFNQLTPEGETEDGGRVWFDLRAVQDQLTLLYECLAPSPFFKPPKITGWEEGKTDEPSNNVEPNDDTKSESGANMVYLLGMLADCEFISNTNISMDLPVDVFTASMGAFIGGEPSRLDTGEYKKSTADEIGTMFRAFSALIVLDIRTTLGCAVDRSFEELQILAQWQLTRVRAYRDYFEAQHMPEGFDHIDNRATQIDNIVREWILTDNVMGYKQAVREVMDMHVEEIEEPFLYLRNHPLMCGIIGATLLTRCQTFEMSINESHLNMDMVHLFSTIRTRLQQNAWPDLDSFIEHHENKGVLLDLKPRSPKDAERRLSLNSGVSLVNYAKNRRNQQVKLDNRLVKDVDMSHTIFATYKALWRHEPCKLGVFDASMAMLHTKLKAKRTDRGSRRTSFDNLQLLSLLQEELQLELPMFFFDYGMLEMVCLGLIRRLNAELVSFPTLVPRHGCQCKHRLHMTLAPAYLGCLLVHLKTDKARRDTLDRIAAIAEAHLGKRGSVVTEDRAVTMAKFFKSKDNPSNALRNAVFKLTQKMSTLSIQ